MSIQYPLDHEFTRDEAVALLRAGMADAMQMIAANYSLPVCWIAAVDKQPAILGSATAFVNDCGAGPYLVTNHHVYEGYMAAREQHPDTVCCTSELRFPLHERLIDADAVRDLATFRIEPAEIEALKANRKFVLTGSQDTWPPNPPRIDYGVFFIGFPREGRNLRPYKRDNVVQVDWVGYTALATATGVSAADITLVFDQEYLVDIGVGFRIPDDWALGGCSGAPLLMLVNQRGIITWRLAGVIYESNATIVKAARADALNPDGTINRHPDPMAYLKHR